MEAYTTRSGRKVVPPTKFKPEWEDEAPVEADPEDLLMEDSTVDEELHESDIEFLAADESDVSEESGWEEDSIERIEAQLQAQLEDAAESEEDSESSSWWSDTEEEEEEEEKEQEQVINHPYVNLKNRFMSLVSPDYDSATSSEEDQDDEDEVMLGDLVM